MIMNRIADVFFIFAIVLLILYFKTVNFVLIFHLIPFFSNEFISFFSYNLKLIDVIAFFILIGAIGKSAQIGLHT